MKKIGYLLIVVLTCFLITGCSSDGDDKMLSGKINAEINMTIQNKNSIFELKNVKINELIFDKNKFQIVCNEAILTIDDIKDIQLIESSSKNNIITNIEQIQGILLEYSENVQEYFNTKIKDLKTLNELFFIS